MNHGRVEQVGTPREIYHRPGSQFVARFFGENNLLPGTIQSRANGEIVVECAFGRVRLDGRHDVGPGNQVTLAVRPEHIQVKPQSNTSDGFSTYARIGSVDFLGATSQVTLMLSEMGDTTVRASLPTTECLGLAAGEHVKLAFSLDNLTLLH